MMTTTTTTIHVDLGWAFWLLMAVLILGIILYSKLGSEKMNRAISGGISDALGR